MMKISEFNYSRVVYFLWSNASVVKWVITHIDQLGIVLTDLYYALLIS